MRQVQHGNRRYSQMHLGCNPKFLAGENPCTHTSHFETYSRVSLRLFALTVKYTLHPLSVEDVIEQCQTKIDRLGGHYFLTIEPIGNLAVTFDVLTVTIQDSLHMPSYPSKCSLVFLAPGHVYQTV